MSRRRTCRRYCLGATIGVPVAGNVAQLVALGDLVIVITIVPHQSYIAAGGPIEHRGQYGERVRDDGLATLLAGRSVGPLTGL